MKDTKKIICILLSICMLTGLLPAGAMAAEAFAVDTVVEAEAGALGGAVTQEKDSTASGGVYITVSGEGRVDDPAAQEPDASYVFDIPADGTYEIWLLTNMVSESSDSFHYRWDGGEYARTGKVTSGFAWIKVTSAQLTKGQHTFDMVHRENGVMFDAWFVTNDPSKVPAEGAPATAEPGTSPGVDVGDLKEFSIPEGGSVMFEAEETTIDGSLATVQEYSQASGQKGVYMEREAKDQTGAELPGAIGFTLSAAKAGTYAVWGRYSAASDGSDSYYSSVGGAAYAKKSLNVTGDQNEFDWILLDNITITEGGSMTYRIRPRESKSVFDKFLVTSVRGYIPEGMVETLPQAGDEEVMPLPSDAYPAPTITPPAEHPRLLFRASDIPLIRANMESEQGTNAMAQFENHLAQTTDGVLEIPKDAGSSNYNGNLLGMIESHAFNYAINGDETSGNMAVSAIQNVLDTSVFADTSDITRAMGHTIFVASEVYDWCYPLLDDAAKKNIVIGCEIIAAQMEIGWPPNRQGAVVGHGGEAQLQRDLLSLGVATYDEYPDIYNYVAGRYLSEFVSPRNYWYTSGSYHQGTNYNAVRYAFDMWAQWIFYRMSGEKIFIDEAGDPMYQYIYYRRPDGASLREGDYSVETLNMPYEYYTKAMQATWLAAGFYSDPYLKMEYARMSQGYKSFAYTFSTLTPVQFFLFNDPDCTPRAVSELPYTRYFGSPNGLMVARTGWQDGIDAPVAMAFMKIGEQWAANHHHLDAGTFQIYYKGMLATDSGIYDAYGTSHDVNWNKETISHNGLLIYDPNETINGSAVNSGGQRRPGGEPNTMDIWMTDTYKTGEVLGAEFGPDPVEPEYSYISGDITAAYSDKVDEVRRSMLFMPTEDMDAPAIFFVMDKVVSSDASFKKTFLLHSLQEPEVSGNVTTIKRDTNGYNGKLVNQTLYPVDATIEKIGGAGSQWLINGINYVPNESTSANANEDLNYGWGRVEISPSTEAEEDYFLNAMYVSDADSEAALKQAELIETEQVLGARLSDRAAVFTKNKERLSGSITFTVPGSGEVKIAAAGLAAGAWTVTAGGSDAGAAIATDEGGIIYFTAPAGEITLTLTDPSAVREPVTVTLPEKEGIGIKIDGQYMYSDVEPTIIDDRTLVPMRAIFENLGADIAWDEATETVTGTRSGTTVTLTIGSTAAYVNGEEVTLDVPAMLIGDRTMVPIRFVSESLGAKVDWEAASRTVLISSPVEFNPLDPSAVQIIDATWSSDNGESENGYKAFDGNPNTRWAAEGVDEWIIFELAEEAQIVSFYTHFNNGASRVYGYELYASTDGVNFTKFLTHETSGSSDTETVTLDAPVTAKYIKYVGKGNTTNLWNSLQEIEFRTK